MHAPLLPRSLWTTGPADNSSGRPTATGPPWTPAPHTSYMRSTGHRGVPSVTVMQSTRRHRSGQSLSAVRTFNVVRDLS